MSGVARFDGSEFRMGGVLRAWQGDKWEPPLALDPTDFAANLWITGDDMAGSDGSAISELVDRSDGGVSIALHGSPVFRGAGFAGHRCVEFGPGSWATIASSLLDLGDDFTVMVALYTLPGNADGMAWMFGEAATYKRRALWCQNTSSANMSGYDSNVISGASTGAPCIISITRIAGFVTIRKNGVLVASASPYLLPYSYTGFGIGANVSGSESYTGRIAELAAFSEPLTPDEQLLIETGWLTKYGI